MLETATTKKQEIPEEIDICWLREAAGKKYGHDYGNLEDVEVVRLMVEDVLLRGQYYALLKRHRPFCEDEEPISDSELQGLIYSFELIATEIPEDLTFDDLRKEGHISQEHQIRLADIWSEIPGYQKGWDTTGRLLKTKWHESRIPEPQREALDFVDYVGGVIRKYRKLIAAVLSFTEEGFAEELVDDGSNHYGLLMGYINSCSSSEEDDVLLSELEEWKEDEKNARLALRDRAKNYYLSQILFYSMLLEESENGDKEQIIRDPALREKIQYRLSLLRIIDVYHQALSVGKAAHHFSEKRLRKLGGIPFVYHPWEVCLRVFKEVAIPMLEDCKDPKEIILKVVLALLHDVVEDTILLLGTIIDFCKNRANKVDSRILNVMQSGFGRTQDQIKSEFLNHLNDEDVEKLSIELKVLNKETKFGRDEIETAVRRNIFGFKRICELLKQNMEDEHINHVMVDEFADLLGSNKAADDEMILSSYQMFPQTYEEKWDELLLRMYAFLDNDESMERVLQNKLCDCDHNITTLTIPDDYNVPNYEKYGKKRLKIEDQLKKLRGSMRLISFVIYDFGIRNQYTLNCLRRLLNTVVGEYERVFRDYPEDIEDVDREYLGCFKEWLKNAMFVHEGGCKFQTY